MNGSSRLKQGFPSTGLIQGFPSSGGEGSSVRSPPRCAIQETLKELHLGFITRRRVRDLGSSENIGAMDSIKEAKSDGEQSQLEEANREKPLGKQQSQLEEADREKPLEKLLIKADLSIPCMLVLITNTAIFVCGGFHYLLAAMKAKGLSFNVFYCALVVYFTVTIVLVIIKARGTHRTVLLVYLNSAVFGYLNSLVALYTVMPSWLFTSLAFLTVALTAIHWFVLLF